MCHISDNGLAWLLQFFLQFLRVINAYAATDMLNELIIIFPTSLYMVRKLLAVDRDSFTKYVVCPKCTKCYQYDECVKMVNGRHVVKRCSSKFYKRGKVHVCDAQLVKKVTLKNNSVKYYPIFYYCYNSIINSLEKLVQRKEFAEKCEKWRSETVEDDLLTDIYSGQLWKDFMKYDGKDFLNLPRNYGLMLNFDFFQPMKHRKDYSVGVLYLVILNLPRSERFKWENVIVVGIIPAMGHEPKHLNEFLKPAVDELRALWKGVRLQSSLSVIPLLFRVALLCTSSDIPATRKLCGFKGHSAELGCSKCLKKFLGSFGEKRDYSGFDRNSWVKQNNRDHRQQAKQILRCKTRSAQEKLSKQYGINYYSALLDLEYFDIVRFCTVDPMHNLFLGTAKYQFKLWVSEGYLNPKQLETIESRIQSMEVPIEIGRLPKAISSNYGSYTAEQWKNWTLIYSLYALKGVLNDRQLRCWQTFVLACKYLCKPVLSHVDILKADNCLLTFCTKFQELYGETACTPNIHLHCHLKEIILDYGPIHSFWCFSFERYNGILGSIKTNNRSIELQLMRKVTTLRCTDNISLDQNFLPYFGDVISSLTNYGGTKMTEDRNNCDISNLSDLLSFYQMDTRFPLHSLHWENLSALTLPSFYKESSLDHDDINILRDVYKIMFPNKPIVVDNLSTSIQKFGTLKIFNQQFGSALEYRSKRSTGILAAWARADGTISEDVLEQAFGLVEFYFLHSIKSGEEFTKHVFACVTWYGAATNSMYNDLNPLVVASKTDVYPGGPSRFLPVQRISAKCGFAISTDITTQCTYIISPVTRSFVS